MSRDDVLKVYNLRLLVHVFDQAKVRIAAHTPYSMQQF